MKLLKSLDQSLFGWGSPVVFGVIRIVTATLALINFLMISIDFEAWFTEKGFTPLWHAQKWGYLGRESWWQGDLPRLDLLGGVTDARVTALVYILCCIACLFSAIGLWTRISSIAMFLLVTTLHHRSPDILHSGDTLLRQMTFLVAIAPSGAALSLDRLLAVAKGKASSVPAMVSIWPQRLMQFQVTVVYFTTVWHKWGGSHWRDGTATWFVPQLHEFDRFPSPAFLDTQPFVAFSTYATLLIELGVAFLAYSKPLRRWALLGGVILHASIEYRFNIPLFSFIMTSTYLSFYDGEEYSAFAKRLGERWSRWKVQVFLPQGASLTSRGANFLHAVDMFSLVEYLPGDDSSWSARKADGSPVNPFAATLKRSPGLWILFVLPGVWKRIMVGCLEQPEGTKPTSLTAQAVNS